jgi:hypothetical protein
VGTAAAIILIAAVAMFDSREVFTQQLRTAPGDVGPSWYPFWSAALMGIAATYVGYGALTRPQRKEGPFETRESITSVLKLIIPMFVYAFAFPTLGFYVATATYMAFFAWFLGKYKWWAIVAAGAITPLTIYLLFEVAFRLILPKSFLYPLGFPF